MHYFFLILLLENFMLMTNKTSEFSKVVGSGVPGFWFFINFFFVTHPPDHYDPIRLKNHTNKEKNHSPGTDNYFFLYLRSNTK